MNKPSVFRTAYSIVQRPVLLLVLFLAGIVGSAVYPTQLDSYPILPAGVRLTEDYLRFIPTVLQVAVPVVLGDKIGMAQLVYVGISTTVATQGAKFLLDNRSVGGTRLGERPRGGHHNMPSGHSSMASCAVYYLGRRYSVWLGLALSLIMLMTMYARVMLNAHTISAVIAGALIGFMTTAIFTSRRQPGEPARQWGRVADPELVAATAPAGE